MQIFAKLAKYDETTGYFEAIATDESLDKSGEIMDYASTKPHFVAWSETISKASDGKSCGNVRAMHGKSAAGKLTDIVFDDDAKAIKVAGLIVDPVDKTKMAAGVYTGVSIGGSYAKKWDDPVIKGVQRYEAIPSEISVVDYPCNGNAFFTVVKADGAEELRKFETSADDAEAVVKWAESLPVAIHDALAKALQPDAVVAPVAAVAEPVAKVAERKDVDAKEGADKYGDDADFADPKNKKYPLDTAKHIKAAWSYIHMPKNAAKYSSEDASAIKAKIVAAWKAKIDKDGPPEAEKVYAAQAERLTKHAEAADTANLITVMLGGEPIEKGLWAVSQFAGLLEQLAWMADNVDWEEEAEGDDSTLPAQMRAALKPLAEAFLAMATEKTNEALHGQMNDDAALALAAKTGDLAKTADATAGGADELAKAGARHNAKDRAAIEAATKHHASAKKHLDAMSEHLATLQASAPAGGDDSAEKLAKAATDLQKVTSERDAFGAQLEKLAAAHAELLTKMAPPKGVVRAVSKDADGNHELNKLDDSPVLKADGSPDHEATAQKMMKVALARPAVTR